MPRAKICLDSQGRFYGVSFDCPGCAEFNHKTNTLVTDWTPPGYERSPHIRADGWTFNGDLERPTFGPSVLLKTGHHLSNPPIPGNCACDWSKRYPEEDPWEWPCGACHSFVVDGRIQFLSDCTHSLAGQTVDLPEVEDNAS